jgi:hypothetical protein
MSGPRCRPTTQKGPPAMKFGLGVLIGIGIGILLVIYLVLRLIF